MLRGHIYVPKRWNRGSIPLMGSVKNMIIALVILCWPLPMVYAAWITPKPQRTVVYADDSFYYTSEMLDTWLGYATCGEPNVPC